MTFALPIVAGVCLTGVTWANKRAMNSVRSAGLLDETREIVRRTAMTFAGDDLSFQFPNRWWSQLGFVLLLGAVAALIGGFYFYVANQLAEQILAALGFALFVGFALLTIATLHQPNVNLDERGVFSYYHNFWPRLVNWHEIESADFILWSNFHDGSEIHTITLKNAAGEILLTLGAASFAGAPPGFEARFVAELRQRLTGDSAT